MARVDLGWRRETVSTLSLAVPIAPSLLGVKTIFLTVSCFRFTGSSNMGTGLDTTVYRPSNFGLVPKRKIELDAE